jgi:2-keto-4-pentenoate hydratase/2-oxohepta-3-ene-1,7-dioic acid hydratase in catechol pathway
MKLLSYLDKGRASYGALAGDGIIDLPAASATMPATLREGLRLGTAALAGAVAGRGADRALADIELLPVIPDPSKIVCVGVNYVDHRQEAGRAKVDHPTLFTRWSDTQVGHEHPVVFPKASTFLDYEGELAVIIGEPAYQVDEAHALEHVAGYSCYDDLSVRDWQRHTSQFTAGKNFVGVGSLGPWMVTADEIADPESLALETRVNGDVRQSAPVKDLIFSVPQLIAYITTFTPLDTGDLIVTGTPGGVGLFRDPPLSLAPGDVVEVEISSIGILRNRIA